MHSHPPDFTAAPAGSVITFTANTHAALRFAASNLGLAEWQWLSPTQFAVDARFAHDLWIALEDEGWVVVPSTTH